MRSTFKVLFYVKKGSEKPNGNLPLMCRITVDVEIECILIYIIKICIIYNTTIIGISRLIEKIHILF